MTINQSYSSQLGTSGGLGSRRRATLIRERQGESDGAMLGMGQKVKEINAATALEKAEMYGVDANDGRAWSSRFWAMAGKVLIEMVPAWFAVGAMIGLIFGGCCSNVCSAAAFQKYSRADFSARCLHWRLLSSELFNPSVRDEVG